MKERYFGFIVALLFPLLLAGCGGSLGAPGSTGGADTGIIIQSVAPAVSTPTSTTATATATNNPDIDTAIHLCTSGKPEKGLFQTFLSMDITAAPLNQNTTSDPFPGSVEQCTITYMKSADNPDAPIIPALTVYPNCPLLSGSNTCTTTFMDIQRKNDFWNALTGDTNYPSTYPVHYVGVIDCTYMNAFGKSGTFQTEVDVWLADWDLCTG